MIVFQNPGLIDIDAITTMGVSVKDGDSPIGYFGTGLKFAITTLLRNECSVTIYRGDEALCFTAEAIEVRGEAFERVCMNGQSLGFTTMLGRNWEPWMAFRELASNCKDEAGRYWRVADDWSLPCEGHTTIIVDGRAIDDVWHERSSIILDREPIYKNEHIEVYEGVSAYAYYRNVRIYKVGRPLSHTYNVLESLELTEDRTAKNWYSVESAIERGIGAMDDRVLLRRIMTCGELYSEHHMNVPQYGNPQQTFRDVAREIALGSSNEQSANPAAVGYARASAIKDMKPGDSMPLDVVQSMMLEKAKRMLGRGGFKIDEFPLIVCDTLGPNIHGMAKDGNIYLSTLPFAKGTREVAATLLEEFAHLKSGHSDCTRGFQNWLFDQLLIRAECAAGEPF